MERSLKGIFVFYSFVGAIILIVMSTLAGAALRSTKSQVKQLETPTSTHIITDSAENFECKWSVFIQHFSSLEDHFTVQVIPIQPFTHTFIQCISGQHFFHEGQFGSSVSCPKDTSACRWGRLRIHDLLFRGRPLYPLSHGRPECPNR